MPTITADDIIEQMKAKLIQARDITDVAMKANRDLDEAERTQVMALVSEATDLKKKATAKKDDAKVKAALADLGDSIGLNEKSGERRTPNGVIIPDAAKSLGEYFTESAQWDAFVKNAPPGGFQEKARVESLPVGFKSLLSTKGKRSQKALLTGASDTSAGGMFPNQWLGMLGDFTPFLRPLTLRDVITNGTTSSDTVEYAQIASVTNNAAPVAEATTAAMPTQNGSTGPLVNAAGGGYKPESAFTTVKKTAIVRTIAHWIPATKRALADASQIRTLIDNFLEYGLEEELEDQIIAGDNSGENFDGIGHISGTQSQAWSTNILETLRKAKTLVRTVGRARPNAYLMHPTDVETVDLLQDNEGRYYFGGPGGAGTAQAIWGLPVVETEAVPQGTAYVGDFTKAILWDREQSSITVTDSHGDFFVRNLVAILAEMRAAFGVIQPNAFVEIDVTA